MNRPRRAGDLIVWDGFWLYLRWRMTNRDERFIETALKAGLLTPDQVEDCRKLRGVLSQNAFAISLPEIVVRKEILNPDQVRLINVAIRYEETREDDIKLGGFISRKGFLPKERVDECLTLQETPWREGRHFPRLGDLLVQKGYLTPQQLHVISRAREQLDARPVPRTSSPSLPAVPSLPPPEPPAPEPAPAASAPAPDVEEAQFEAPAEKPAVEPVKIEKGLRMPQLKVTARRPNLREAGGDLGVWVMEAKGVLDGHTFERFEKYILGAIEAGNAKLVLNCEGVSYISSAGIGVLSGAVKLSRDRDGDIRLCNVTEPVKKVLEMLGLHGTVRSYGVEKAAVLSFKYS